MKRIDLVVLRYTKNPETEIEETNWVVIQGTPAASDPVAPAYTEGNMQEGDLTDDCPFCEVHLDGIQVTEVVKLMKVLDGNLESLNSKITPLTDNASKQAAQAFTAGQKYYFDEDGWIYFECQMTNANGYCRFRIFNASGSEILGYQANAVATQQVAMQSGLYPVKKGWYTQLGQYRNAISQQFYFIKP